MEKKRIEIRDYGVRDYLALFTKASAKAIQIAPVFNFFAYLAVAKRKEREFETKKVEGIRKDLGLESGKEKALKIGYIVKKHFGNAKRTGSPQNVLDEVWLSDDELRQHVQVAGTTGSGKTVWLKALIEQQIARGGGAFAVFGKADNKMLQQIHYSAAKYGREQDLFVIDWTATPEDLEFQRKTYRKEVITNAINLFDVGDEDAVVNIFLKISNIGDKDSWNQAAKAYLETLIRFLYRLHKLGLTFDVEALDRILRSDDKLAEIDKNREELNFYFLREMISDKKAIFKLLAIVDEIYIQNKQKIIEKMKIAGLRYEDLEAEKYRIDAPIRAALAQQVKTDIPTLIANVRKKKSASPIEALEAKGKGSQSPFYKLEVSLSQTTKILQFYERYGLVLKNRNSDINLIDAINSSKIIVFNLPGQNEEDAAQISDFFMSLIETLIKKRGKSKAFDLTYLLILDEINSWAARNEGKVGIGNILSVVRGLGVGVILAYQSDLGGLDREKRELEQINANVNTTILLKTQSNAIRDFFNKKVKKREVLFREEKLRSGEKKEGSDTALKEEKLDYFAEGDLEKLASGEGYVVKNGHAYPFLTEYRGEMRFYENEDEAIEIVKTISV